MIVAKGKNRANMPIGANGNTYFENAAAASMTFEFNRHPQKRGELRCHYLEGSLRDGKWKNCEKVVAIAGSCNANKRQGPIGAEFALQGHELNESGRQVAAHR
jgi:hypothetical protein